MTPNPTHANSRAALWTGGIALLLIAVLAGVGNFALLGPLINGQDAAHTAQNIAGSGIQFRLGVLCMTIAAVLDIVVAAALFALIAPFGRTVAATAAWFRIAYAAIFLTAITQLATAPNLLHTPDEALNAVNGYTTTWRIGLILFAAHLAIVGYQGFRARFMPRVLGILIIIAGAGYLVDGIGTILISDYTPTVSTFTFIGEVALIVWLIVSAIRTRPRSTSGDRIVV